MAENIEQLYDNLKGNFLFDFENQDEFKNFLETNPEADKTMSEMFGVENASSLLKKKEDVSISSSPSVGVETQKVVANPTMGMEKEARVVNQPPVKPIRQPSAYNKNIESRDFQAHQELTRSLLKSAQKNDSAGISNAQLQLERLRASNPNIASDPLLNEDLKIANKFIKAAPTQTAQQKFNFQKQVIEGPKPSKSERVKAFDEFAYNSKLPERTAMEVQADEQKLDLQLQKDADQVLKFGNWNDKNVTEANDEGFLFKNDNGIVEINPLYTGKKIESYVNSALDIPKELKGVVTQRLTRLVESKLEEKFLMEGAKKKLEEKLSKEGRTLEDIQRAPVLAISAVESVVNNSKKTVSDFDKTNINYIEGELNKIKEQNNAVIDPLLKNIQNRINNKLYGSKEEYEAEYAQYVNAVSEANKKTESAKANLFEGYKQKRQQLVENVQKQREADLEKINKQYGIEMENGQLKLKDYNKIFEESMNEFQSERENEREEEQIWSKALKRYPLGAFQKMGGTLLDRIQAKSARTFSNAIEALNASIGTENNPLTGALKYLDYVEAKSKPVDISFSDALKKGNFLDIVQSVITGIIDQVPNVSVGISTAILTKNPWVAGSVGWSQDTVDQIGEAYKQKFKETGSVDEARDAAGETLKVQTAMFPLYAIQFAPFSKGFLSTAKGFTTKAIATDVAELGATELLPEITTEIIQNFKSDQLAGKLYNKETGKNMGIGEYSALNGGKISLDVLPTVLAMSGSAVISERLGEVSTAKAIDKLKSSLGQRGLSQSMADAIDVLGENSVGIIPEYLYRTGNIDVQEFVAMKKNMDELIKTYPSVRNIIGNEDKSRYYLDLMLQKKDMETAMADPKNEAVKELYQKRIDELSKTMDNIVNNKNVEDYTVFTAKDGFKYVTDNQRANAILTDKNTIESINSGDLKVESNDSKITEKVKQIEATPKVEQAKGPQTVTGTQSATNLNGATIDNKQQVEKVKQETQRNETEFNNLTNEIEVAQGVIDSRFADGNVKIVLHSPASYNQKMSEVNGKQNSKGNFSFVKNDDGTYGVEIQLNAATADAVTVAHEVSHAVMLADFGTDITKFVDMKNRLANIVSDSDNKTLNDFVQEYKNSEKAEEYLAQLSGIMRTEGTRLNPTTLSKIAQLINDIVGKLTNGRIVPFKDINDTQQVINYFNNLADSYNSNRQQNAIQEQTTSQVPVQPEATGSQEMEEGKPQTEPQVTTQKEKEVKSKARITLEDVKVTKGKYPNPSFSDMIDFNVEGGYLEIGQVKGSTRYGIITLMVDEEQRSKGIATALLKRALNETKGELSGMASNDVAVALNYKLGMRAVEDGKELSLEETKKQRADNSWESIRMILPEGKRGDNYEPFVEPQVVTEENQSEEVIAQSLDNPIRTENVEGRQIEPGYEVFNEEKTIDVQSSKTNRGPNLSSKSQIKRDFKLEDTDFVNPEEIDGKTMMGFLGDLQLAGTVTSPTGVELNGRGGPGFTKWANRNIEIDPATGLYKGTAALWASTFEDSTTKLANKMRKVDGSLIGAQQKTGVLGNVKMLNYFTDELSNAIKSGVSEKEIIDILNRPLDSSMTKVPLRDYLKLEGNFESLEEMNAYLNPFVSTEEFKNRFGKNKNVDKVSYEFRANYFGKIFNITNHEKFNLPSLATGKGYTYDKTVLDYANDSLFENAGYGDFVGYLTYDPSTIKIEKVSEDSEFYNPSYPFVITAEKVGMKFFNNFLDGRSIFYDVKPVSATANQTPFGLREKDQAARAIMGAMPITDFDAKKIAERQKEFQSKSQKVASKEIKTFEDFQKANEQFGIEDGAVAFKSKSQASAKEIASVSDNLNKSLSDNELENLKKLINGEIKAPTKTKKAYKLFKVKKEFPGELFPLFVNANESVSTGQWSEAKAGELTQTKEGKTMVKSKIGPLAYRPGWHSGELAVATHIGAKINPNDKAPALRAADQVWAEVEVADDVNWQTIANERADIGKNGKPIAKTAHITDQIPFGGSYSYKTNSNMTGSWVISGEIKVNRVLTEQEVAQINKEGNAKDLPRTKPFEYETYGFNQDGSVKNPKQVVSNQVARAYVNAKETNTNPELVNSVESALGIEPANGPQFQSKSQLNPDNIGTQYQADIAANKTKNEALSNLFKAGYTYDDIARKLGEVTFSQQDWNNMVSEDAKEVAKKISDAKIQSQENIRNFITEPNNAILPLEILREKLLGEGYSNPQILKAFEDLDIAEQGEIDELFGKDYRETIKNALNTEEYSEYFTSLTSDERSAKAVKRESDLRTEAEMSGINLLDGIVYVENVANELEAGGLLATAQMLRDKIANKEVNEDVSSAIKTLAKIQSIAGRLLYINRGLFTSPDKLSNMLSESIIKGGVALSPFQKEKVKVLIDNFNTAKQNTEKSLQTFEETFTDVDFNQYEKDKKNFENASKELIKFLDALKPKFWNDRVTSAGSRALLGFQTVFLSLYANVEQAILSDNVFFKGMQSLGDMKGIKTNTVNPQLLLNSYRFSWDKSKQEIWEMFKYGNQANSDFIEKYMDSMANINFFDDVKLSKDFVFNLLGKIGGKKITEMTDEEFADAFDQALYKTKDGKLKLVDGKTYTAARSMFWGIFGSIPEFTGRAMAFGGDKLLANATTYRAMLDYFTTQDLSKGYFGDFVSDGSQVDEKTLQKLIVLIESTLGNENFFEKEGLKRVFLADNLASQGLGSARGYLRKKIKQKAREIREGEGSQINKVMAKQAIQLADTTVWTVAPFARVPWNVVMAANQKVNPLAASYFYYNSARNYNTAKEKFDSKYGEVVQFKNKDEKMQYEKDRIQLFGLKRQMTYDQACISESAFVFALAATAYAAGALIPALLPGDDEEIALASIGFKSGSYNRTIHWEYMKALYNGKEKEFFIKRGTWIPGDNVEQFSNMGLIGYGFGSYASGARKYEKITVENRNKLTPDLIKSNLFALVTGQFLYAGVQQLPMLQGIARVGQLFSEGDEASVNQFLASTSATALSFTSPGLFSVISKANAETVQSLNQVNLRTEDLNILGDVFGEVGVRMIQKLNRNVSFIAKNQFYKAKIGPYGEDLQFRTTNAEPGTLGAYVETIFNPFASRRIGLQDSKRETQRYRFAVGISANMYQLSQAYRELTGGTIAQKPNMTIEGDLVSVLTKEIPNEFTLESNGIFLKYNLPNDMYRNELKKRGDILYNLHQDVYQKSIDNINYLQKFYKGEQNKKQAMGNIEQLFAYYKNTSDQADGSWLIDYKQSREKANLLEMKRRGVLDETQFDKLRQIYGNF